MPNDEKKMDAGTLQVFVSRDAWIIANIKVP